MLNTPKIEFQTESMECSSRDGSVANMHAAAL